MNPIAPTAAREFVDLRTGRTWTLTYAQGPTGHTVGVEVPFGHPLRSMVRTFRVLEHARRFWRAMQCSLIREGFTPVPA